MPDNILPTTPPPPDKKKKKKKKVSGVAVLMVIILTIVIIVLGERFMFDLNRWFNPAFDQFGSYSYRSSITTMTKTYTQENYE